MQLVCASAADSYTNVGAAVARLSVITKSEDRNASNTKVVIAV